MSAFVADLARHGRSHARRFGGPTPKSRDMLNISKSSPLGDAGRYRENYWEFWLGWDLLCQGCRSLCACDASASSCVCPAGASLGLNVGDLL